MRNCGITEPGLRLSQNIILTVLMTFVTAGCHAQNTEAPKESFVAAAGEADAASTPPPQQSPALSADEIKEGWALDGTDLVPLANLIPKQAADIENFAGQYITEQGGSTVKLEITESASENAWNVTRLYQEPGRPVHKKSYRFTLDGRALTDQNGNKILHTSEGLLLLEVNSGLESIPASYWVHYLHSSD